jgi:hypothetical protein
VSANPRFITADTTVSWGQPGCLVFLRRGTVLDVVPGGQLETAIGAGSLSGIIPAGQRGDGTCLSRAAQAN